MNTAIGFLNQCAEHWFRFVLHSGWQAAAVAGVLLVLVMIGRKWPAPVRYALLLIALTKFAVPPFGFGGIGVFGMAGPVVGPVEAGSGPSIEYAQPSLPESAATKPTISAAPATTALMPALSWKARLLLLHFIGTLATLIWVIWQIVRLRALVRSAKPACDPTVIEGLRIAGQRMEFSRLPRLLITGKGYSPMVFGLFRPVVILPKALVELSEHELQAVLGHELAHIRRRDLYVNWIQLLLLAIWWFHPMLWLVNRALRSAREDCCDDLLLSRKVTTSNEYCEGLMRAARHLMESSIGSQIACGERLHPLGRRITRLMDDRIPRWAHLSTVSLVGVILLGVCTLPGLRGQAQNRLASSASPFQSNPPGMSVPITNQTNRTEIALAVPIAGADEMIQGRSESEWIKSIVYNGNDDQRRLWQSFGPRGIKILARALNSQKWERETRMCVASLLCDLANFDDPNAELAIPSVLAAIQTEKDESVRAIEFAYFERIIQVMSAKDKAILCSECMDALKSKGSGVRHNALIGLQHFSKETPNLIPAVAAVLNDSDPDVRIMAARTLTKVDPERAAQLNVVSVIVDSLAILIRSRAPMGEAEVSLLGRDPDLGIPVFIQALQSDVGYLRGKSAGALGGFGNRATAAIPALQKALNDPDELVRTNAAAALRRIERSGSRGRSR